MEEKYYIFICFVILLIVLTCITSVWLFTPQEVKFFVCGKYVKRGFWLEETPSARTYESYTEFPYWEHYGDFAPVVYNYGKEMSQSDYHKHCKERGK